MLAEGTVEKEQRVLRTGSMCTARREKDNASKAASETQSCHNTEAHPKPGCWHWLHQAEACRASNSEQAKWATAGRVLGPSSYLELWPGQGRAGDD